MSVVVVLIVAVVVVVGSGFEAGAGRCAGQMGSGEGGVGEAERIICLGLGPGVGKWVEEGGCEKEGDSGCRTHCVECVTASLSPV
jgi:hypothetical protein